MRTTKNQVQRLIDILNGMLGIEDTETYSVPGKIVLGSAYGGYRIEMITNEYGGITTISESYGTLREAYSTVKGMLAATRIARGERP